MALKASVNSRKRNTRSYHNNRANQLNPNNDAYWKLRGHDEKPNDRNNTPSAKKNEN